MQNVILIPVRYDIELKDIVKDILWIAERPIKYALNAYIKDYRAVV